MDVILDVVLAAANARNVANALQSLSRRILLLVVGVIEVMLTSERPVTLDHLMYLLHKLENYGKL